MVIGAMYTAVMFVGINNCATIQPIVLIERTVFYRERAAGMYSAMPYAIAQDNCPDKTMWLDSNLMIVHPEVYQRALSSRSLLDGLLWSSCGRSCVLNGLDRRLIFVRKESWEEIDRRKCKR